ncbi:hypothetical protein KC19_9G179600 [Ceratodon purpureus]|uniref:Secreted protein n=1 Tax=Ceratodon purpureus TaxID=3225 RepID=A0A8T0GWV0_CERPU|nr:hypothetical protein KC19_9G179600 [Ceratodon purpureus]
MSYVVMALLILLFDMCHGSFLFTGCRHNAPPFFAPGVVGFMMSALNSFSDRRLADHFGGKLHLGYVQIRVDLRITVALQGAFKG